MMDKQQLIAAINKRVTTKLSEHEIASLEMVLFIALYHPDLKNISVQDLAARLTENGFYSNCNIRQMLPAAVTKAQEQGVAIKADDDMTTRYQVAFGHVVNETPKTIREVYQAVYAKLEKLNLLPDEDFSLWPLINENDPWPAGRWVASFAVTGSSEGHYLHVGVVVQHDERWLKESRSRYVAALRESGVDQFHAEQYANAILVRERQQQTLIPVFIGKSFAGMEELYQTAAEIARMLA
jgi:hypothetical protein